MTNLNSEQSSAATGESPDVIDRILAQWKDERPDLDPTPIAVFGRITRTYQLNQGRLRSLLAAFELTPATFDVLANLRRSGPGARKTAGEIAKSSLLSTGGTTFRLDRLEERGLISRSATEYDRRVTNVELTEEGRALIDEVMSAHLAQEARLLGDLSPAEVEMLAGLLAKLEGSVVGNS